MLDPAQLAALAAIHRRGSFDLAAADLNVTPSAISQRLKALEDTVGTLLIRRAKPCAATEAGLRLIRHHDTLVLLDSDLARDLPYLSQRPGTTHARGMPGPAQPRGQSGEPGQQVVVAATTAAQHGHPDGALVHGCHVGLGVAGPVHLDHVGPRRHLVVTSQPEPARAGDVSVQPERAAGRRVQAVRPVTRRTPS